MGHTSVKEKVGLSVGPYTQRNTVRGFLKGRGN